MSVVTVSPEYSELLTRFPPKIIRTEKENERYTKILYDLDRRSKPLTRAEKELAELLTLLIEDFEGRQYQLPQTKPLDVLNFLMDQHGLRQKDLVDVFWDTKHCVGSPEWQAGVEQRAHQTPE